MPASYEAVRRALHAKRDPQKALILQRFFKTGPGEYGEGDRFLGITVPVLRTISRQFSDVPFPVLKQLLLSPIHEERFLALAILRLQIKRDPAHHKAAVLFYLKHLDRINNWDLVDASAEYILGPYFIERDKKIIYKLLQSKTIWHRRVAIFTTFHFIRQRQFADTLRMAEALLTDKHDLMHKAVGWMLREIGKRDVKILEGFLKKHAHHMPRTALRYAIERFSPAKRKTYLKTHKSTNKANP